MKKPKKSRPIARVALKQRDIITPYTSELDDIHDPVDNRVEIIENLGREGGTLSPSPGEDPPLKGPPPEAPVKKPCGCGGDPKPSAAQSADRPPPPRELLRRWLEQNVRTANKEGKAREEAQLALFDEMVSTGRHH